MKKVDVIFPVYRKANMGPTGTIKRLLANQDYLRLRGYDINVFTLDFVKSESNSADLDLSHGLDLRNKLKNYFKNSRMFSILFNLRAIKQANVLVDKYLKLNRSPDVVVFHELNAPFRYFKKHKSDVKSMCFFHNDGTRLGMLFRSWPKLQNSLYVKYFNKRFDFILNNIDKCIFIAKIGQSNFLAENSFFPKSKTTFFHNGIDDCSIQKSKTSTFKYNLCTTGTVCQRKGQYLIIEAMHLMDKVILNDTHLTIVGAGPDLQILADKVQEYSLTEHVTFLGSVANDKVHEILCNNNIYILMSNNEGLPISIIEAMRAGLPVISTNVSGIPEQVDSSNGFLIEPNEKDLLSIFNRLDKIDWFSLGKASRQRFELEFSFNKMISSYCDTLDSLI